jgi:signal transduction histidine kinase
LTTHVNSLDLTLKKVIENTKRGGEILNRLIDFTRFQDRSGPVSIHEAVEHSLCLWGYKRNLELVDFRDLVPLNLPPVAGIFSQIEGIIYNLLDNAYDAVMQKEEAWEQGTLPAPAVRARGVISIRAEAVTRDSTPFVEIRVSDTGIGMTGETLQKIYVPFFTSKPTSIKGSGLGLYVIKKMVEAHQGIIEVDSHYGEGTTFRVLFPTIVELEKQANLPAV